MWGTAFWELLSYVITVVGLPCRRRDHATAIVRVCSS